MLNHKQTKQKMELWYKWSNNLSRFTTISSTLRFLSIYKYCLNLLTAQGNRNTNAFKPSLKNFHCFWAYKRCNVNELLPGLHIWWKQLQHSLYTFCILSVVCVYQWLPVCFEQTKPFLEMVHNSRKCIFSTTKKLEMHFKYKEICQW